MFSSSFCKEEGNAVVDRSFSNRRVWQPPYHRAAKQARRFH
uniref:Uncharacterized protein n=1 Tax=Setaria viridis TaxID=4556 RepID=A0A4U6UE29_SETVI|nr:hypothetical protein SEVIR_5G148475v2 [Setaria viridis]